jgi:hypothetical protein
MQQTKTKIATHFDLKEKTKNNSLFRTLRSLIDFDAIVDQTNQLSELICACSGPLNEF